MLTEVSRSIINAPAIDTGGNAYLNPTETGLVVKLAASVAPRVMIEFGVQAGRTAKAVLDHIPELETYIGVDVPFTHRTTLPAQQTEVPERAGQFALQDKRFYLLICRDGSQQLSPDDLEPCDAVFIDGDHSEDAVLHDSYLARELIRPGGIIIWHDLHNGSVEVTAAISKLCEAGWSITHIHDTWLAFCRC